MNKTNLITAIIEFQKELLTESQHKTVKQLAYFTEAELIDKLEYLIKLHNLYKTVFNEQQNSNLSEN